MALIENIIVNFPHPTLTPCEGEPTFQNISNLHLELNANAASIHSNLGEGLMDCWPSLSPTWFSITPQVWCGLNRQTRGLHLSFRLVVQQAQYYQLSHLSMLKRWVCGENIKPQTMLLTSSCWQRWSRHTYEGRGII